MISNKKKQSKLNDKHMIFFKQQITRTFIYYNIFLFVDVYAYE
jgi:hypothetical protein